MVDYDVDVDACMHSCTHPSSHLLSSVLTMDWFLQVKLLNSISDNFHEAMKSSQGKLEFSQQFDAIVRGVEESLRKQLTVLAGKDQMVEESKGIYQRVSHSSSPSHCTHHIPLLSHPLIISSYHILSSPAGRRAAQVLQDGQGLPGRVQQERLAGVQAGAAALQELVS